jgi:hypothetical protein
MQVSVVFMFFLVGGGGCFWLFMGFLLCAGMTRFLGLEEVFDFLEEYMVVSCEKF